jgi:hypothetical protein
MTRWLVVSRDVEGSRSGVICHLPRGTEENHEVPQDSLASGDIETERLGSQGKERCRSSELDIKENNFPPGIESALSWFILSLY